MITFILIHGAWHGGWCWKWLTPLLEAKGHRVLAPDLPGLGADKTPLDGLNLETWIAHISDLIVSTVNPDEKVILVGHSRGGIVASSVAERLAERVAKVVFVTAFLLQEGQTLSDFALRDEHSVVTHHVSPTGDHSAMLLEEAGAAVAFYGHCSEAQVADALPRLRPEPMFSFITPVSVTEERFGRLPKYYIECSDDNTISLGVQRLMHAAFPGTDVHTLQSDHSPFMSHPGELAEILLSIA